MNKKKKTMSNKHKDAFETYKKEMGITEDTDVNAMKPEDYAIYNTYKTSFEQEQQANKEYQEGTTALNEQVSADRQQNLAMYDRIRKYLPQQIAQSGMGGLGVAQDTIVNANNSQVSQMQNINKMYNKKYENLGSVYDEYMKNLGDTTEKNLYVGQQNKNTALDNEAKTTFDTMSKEIEQIESNANLSDSEVAQKIIEVMDKYKDYDFRGGKSTYDEWYNYYQGQIVESQEEEKKDAPQLPADVNPTNENNVITDLDNIPKVGAGLTNGKQGKYFEAVKGVVTEENLGKYVNFNYGSYADGYKGFYKIVKKADGTIGLEKMSRSMLGGVNTEKLAQNGRVVIPDGYKVEESTGWIVLDD